MPRASCRTPGSATSEFRSIMPSASLYRNALMEDVADDDQPTMAPASLIPDALATVPPSVPMSSIAEPGRTRYAREYSASVAPAAQPTTTPALLMARPLLCSPPSVPRLSRVVPSAKRTACCLPSASSNPLT
jgi:hypothetical protein